MSFRDDHDAALARIAALEDEVEQLKARERAPPDGECRAAQSEAETETETEAEARAHAVRARAVQKLGLQIAGVAKDDGIGPVAKRPQQKEGC